MQRALLMATLTAILAVPASSTWGATPVVEADTGVNSRTWDANSSPGTVEILAVWTPARSVFNTEQYLIGECIRLDGLGFGVGKNKITFRNITLIGADSGNEATASNQKEKLRGGFQRDLAIWFLTDTARALFAQDSAVVIFADVKVGGKVLALDQLTCAVGVSEVLDASSSRSGSGLQWSGDPLPAVEGVELPRLLTGPARP